VQWDVQPGRLLLVFFHEVGVDAAEDRLVRYDEDVFAALEFHDDGLEADYDVAVAGGCQFFLSFSLFCFGFIGKGGGKVEKGKRKTYDSPPRYR
jgi:hypothetical protein